MCISRSQNVDVSGLWVPDIHTFLRSEELLAPCRIGVLAHLVVLLVSVIEPRQLNVDGM